MCGFVGQINFNGQPINRNNLVAARDQMIHRGPDEKGIWLNEYKTVGMAHRRLSILDLNLRSNQPFLDQTGRYVMVYNGEVYNFRELIPELEREGFQFTTTSDTEVVINALICWGGKALDRFNGMFSLAFYDTQLQALLLVRDRLGVKPLYVDLSQPQSIRFASTLSPLMTLENGSRHMDLAALALYVKFQTVPSPNAALEKVIKVPPGGILTVDRNGRIKQDFWWRPQFVQPADIPGSERELLEHLDALIHKAVEYRMISDVPVGVLLSAGIDSTLIASHMAQLSKKPIQTFTIGFDEKKYNESTIARKIARYLKSDHHELIAKPNDLLLLLDTLIENYDEPFADVSAIPTLMVSQLARQNVTVALCGDGGDEFFGGYLHHQRMKYIPYILKIPKLLRQIISRLSVLFPNKLEMGVSLFNQDSLADQYGFMRGSAKAMAWDKLFKISSGSLADLFRDEMAWRWDADTRLQVMAADYRFYLCDDILMKGDRASMAFSLELRHPLLDINLLEFSFALNPKYMFRNMRGKWILRQLSQWYLPPEISKLPKKGFGVPIGQWIRGPLKSMALDLLSPENLKDDPLLNSGEVQLSLKRHFSGRNNFENLIWSMMVYQLWRKKWNISL